MEVREKQNNMIKFVSYNNFGLWDTKRYLSEKIKSRFPLVRLGVHIKEQNHRVKLYDFPDTEFGILGINNKTGIYDAYIEKGLKINQSYKKMEKGWLAYNPYRVNVGSIGIYTNGLKNEYISPAYVVFSCKEDLAPEFLLLLFKTTQFNRIINESTTGSVRQNLNYEILKAIEIPLPNPKEQDVILKNYNELISISNKLEIEANSLSESIEDYVFQFLGISKNNSIIIQKGLNYVKSSSLKTWSVKKILNSNKTLLVSNKFNNKPLSNLMYINPVTDIGALNANDAMTFLPMECISDEKGEIIERRDGIKLNSHGYTKFKENDIIWAKITPCMENGKSAIARRLTNGFGYGSTEYHVIRKKEENFLIDFAYYLLRLQIVRKEAAFQFIGSSGQQRVPGYFLEDLIVPVPPIKIQLEFVEQMKKMNDKINFLKTESEKYKIQAVKEFELKIFKK